MPLKKKKCNQATAKRNPKKPGKERIILPSLILDLLFGYAPREGKRDQKPPLAGGSKERGEVLIGFVCLPRKAERKKKRDNSPTRPENAKVGGVQLSLYDYVNENKKKKKEK